jgi:hypothetical protein
MEGNFKVHGRFCKKLLRLLRCTANGMVEMELGSQQEGEYDADNKILATS